MTNYFIISLITILLIWRYRSDYYRGLYVSVFFLVLMPKDLSIVLSIALPSITIHRVIIVIMFIMWIRNRDVRSCLHDTSFLTILSLLAVASSISALLSDFPLASIKRYLYFLMESLLFYVMLETSIKKERKLSPLIKTVLAALTIAAILGIIEKHTGYNPFEAMGSNYAYSFENLKKAPEADVIVSFEHRILFGAAMAVGLFYCLFSIDKARHRPVKAAYWFYSLLAGAALYFSMSRGPWLAFIVASLFIFILSPKAMGKRLLIISCLTLAVFFIRPGTYGTIKRLYDSTLQADSVKGSNFHWRFQVLHMAYTQIRDSDSVLNLLFGFGQASHAFMEFPEVELSTGYYADFSSWDNELAVILIDQGPGGLILLLCFYSLVLRRGMAYYLNYNQHRDVMLLSLSTLLIILFMKTNVKIFAPQINYLEFTSISIISALLSSRYMRY